MIAQRRVDERPRIANARSATTATELRRSHAVRSRYAGLLRFSAALCLALLAVMAYVTLTANLTGLNYALGRAERQRASLQDETLRLDDRIAALRSDDRLARIAAELGMREPQQFAKVALPRSATERKVRGRVAVLSTVADWLRAK